MSETRVVKCEDMNISEQVCTGEKTTGRDRHAETERERDTFDVPFNKLLP